jgi:hypothetical protein
MDNFTKHRLNDEAILRAQQRASHRKPYHNTLPGDPSPARQPRHAHHRPREEWPNDAIDPGDLR